MMLDKSNIGSVRYIIEEDERLPK